MDDPLTIQHPTPHHLIILVHGINTRAQWMTEIKQELEKHEFAVAATSYGDYSVIRFLLPFSWAREKPIERVTEDIKTALRSYRLTFNKDPDSMSVISHSFGTFVVSEILKRHPEFKWERIVFCGSVVREDFRFGDVLDRFRSPLLNEVGSRDYLPAIAESAGWAYGSVGSTGFNRPPVDTRWHRGFKHSDFLTKEFCREYWVPFLNGDQPRNGDSSSHLPLYIRTITLFPLRYLILLSIAMIIYFISVKCQEEWVTWTWEVPYIGNQEEREAELEADARLPDDSPRPAYLRLSGSWRLSTNGDVVVFGTSYVGNTAMFSYFGSTTVIPLTSQNADIMVLGNGLRCSYAVSIRSKSAMQWTLVKQEDGIFSTPGANDKCPGSSLLERFK